MASLTSLIQAHGTMHTGLEGSDILALQVALELAGYRVGKDGDFGPRTEMVVKNFQAQHGLPSDGIVGLRTAAIIDLPPRYVVAAATPLVASTGWPHDDTASLIAFYGDPRDNLEGWKAGHVTTVPCPWPLFYAGTPWNHAMPIHQKCAASLASIFDRIWNAAGKDPHSPMLERVRVYSGSGNLRPVRGSSRVSTHGFWAAIDYDADRLPLGHRVPAATMPQEVVDAFKAGGAFWGGDFIGRPDPMHFQWAHE